MIPYAILSGKIIASQGENPILDGKAGKSGDWPSCRELGIRILDLSEEGFTFRLSNRIEKKSVFSLSGEQIAIELQFYHLKENRYEKVELQKFSLNEEEEEAFYTIYRVTTEDEQFRQKARCLMQEYTRYIHLKIEKSDAVMSQELTGYPAWKDEIFPRDFLPQKRDLLSKKIGQKKSCLVDSIQELGYSNQKSVSTSREDVWEGNYELALSIDRPSACEKYLARPLKEFVAEFWMEQGLKEHPLTEKEVTVLYFGNQFCPFLFPNEQLFSLLDKALEEKCIPVVVFSYMTERQITATKECLDGLATWCQEQKTTLEIVINDWGMAALIREEGYNCFYLTMGILLQKRKKDVRLAYKKTREMEEELQKNALDAPFYQEYLQKRYGIERISYEACGYSYAITARKASLHLPFYQMNTAEHCTLYAACKNGARGRQSAVKHCPRYCEEQVFLYPEHLHMVGRYNSLFGYDEQILEDASYLKMFLEQGVDRIVMEML